MSRGLRSVIAQLRSCTLPLKIETGRFNHILLEERICDLCNLNQVESESHFMFNCPLYDSLRTNLIPEVCTNNLTEVEKWCLIFDNHHLIKSSALYLKDSLQKRTNCIFKNV